MLIHLIHSRLLSVGYVTCCAAVSFVRQPGCLAANQTSRKSSGMSVTVSDPSVAERARVLAPPLTNDKHKGQAGRIGVFGGSLEYTGAPYFASISALKTGADLVYVFCAKDAAPVIKSYSPELIVLPFLDDSEAVTKIEPWLERLHVVLIGPGLGREERIFSVIEQVIDACRSKKKPLAIDADGLFFVSQKPEVLSNYPSPVILTPNAMEFTRLVGLPSDPSESKLKRAGAFLKKVGDHVTILCKDHEDEVIGGGRSVKMSGGGSGRRCGGQGDLLAGSLSTFFAWAIEKDEDIAVACFAASKLIRDSNARAFGKFGRSMTASDMIHELHEVFNENFELKCGAK